MASVNGAVLEPTRHKRRMHHNRQFAHPAVATPDNGAKCTHETVAGKLLLYVYYPAALLVAIAICVIRPVSEPDCWFHMAFGRYVLRNASLPPGDLFSFTGFGNEWISTGWLPSLALHLLFSGFRSWGLVCFVFAAIAPLFLMMYFLAANRYNNRGSVVLLLLVTCLAAYIRFTPRPEVCTLLMMGLLVMILNVAEESLQKTQRRVPRLLWTTPALMAVWANLHGEFLIGLLPLGLFGATRLLKWRKCHDPVEIRCGGLCAIAGAAWLLNPYGASILKLVANVSSIPSVKTNLFEYLPLLSEKSKLLPWPTYLGIGLLLAAAVGTVLSSPLRIPWWQTILAVTVTSLAFSERRHLGIAAVVLAGIALPYGATMDKVLSRQKGLVPAIVIGLVLLTGSLKSSGAMGVGDGLFTTGRDRNILPVTAVEYLDDNRPPANMFNTYGPGGYLLYFLGPETKVFIDGRFFVYSPQIWEDFLAAEQGRLSIDEICKRYDIKTFLVYFRDDPQNPETLANRLTARSDFKLIYFGNSYAIFVRDLPETAAYIRPREFRYINPFAASRMMDALSNPATQAAALDELNRAREISGRSAPAMALSVMAYRQVANELKAEELLQSGLEANPNSGILQRLRKSFAPFTAASR